MLQLFVRHSRGINYNIPVSSRLALFHTRTSSGVVDSPIPAPDNEEEKRQQLISEIKRKLRGPLADENGNLPEGKDRPIAIEVDGPSHFYVNTTKYTAYTKLKHRLLTRMGYKVLHVPYFEWRKLKGSKEREAYMKAKLEEEPSEWLDPADEKYHLEKMGKVSSDSNSSPPPPSTPRPYRSQSQ